MRDRMKQTLRTISHAVLGKGGQTKKERAKSKVPSQGILRGNYAGYKKRMARDPDTITKTKPFGTWFKEKYPGETMPKR